MTVPQFNDCIDTAIANVYRLDERQGYWQRNADTYQQDSEQMVSGKSFCLPESSIFGRVPGDPERLEDANRSEAKRN